jgi:hypothetical protein
MVTSSVCVVASASRAQADEKLAGCLGMIELGLLLGLEAPDAATHPNLILRPRKASLGLLK